MDAPKPQSLSQHLDQMKNSAVSNTGTANNYNIAGNQYLQYAALPKIWEPPLMLPPRAQLFVGREKDIAWLLQQLMVGEAGIILALCGTGGIGKTALAAEALSRLIVQERGLVCFPDGIFYHSFYTYPSLDVAFEELARVFGGEPSGDPYLAARRAVSHRHALLVFDGVEVLADTRLLRELGGKNVVLVLSRRQSDAPDQAHRRDLDVLPQEQAITLLQELAGPRAADRQSVEWLVQHIGGYPLALQLIGSYLFSYQEEVGDYLQWFKSAGLAALHHGEHQDQSVSVLLQRTYDSLAPIEQHLYMLIGLLAPAPFPLELVQTILELPEQTVRQSLGLLVNLSILRRLGQNYEVSHPLIHTFATERLSSLMSAPSSPLSEAVTKWQEQFLNTLTAHFEQGNPYNRIDLTLWYPHVFLLVSTNYLTAEQSLKAARLFNAVGISAFTQGKYTEAEPLYVRALTIYEQQLGAMHPDIAGCLNKLAVLYTTQGRYAEAELLYQRALLIRERQLGATHPDTAISLSTLAQFYINQGKYTEAESYLQQAYTIFEKQLGIQDILTAACLNDLARLYQAQGKYTEAEPLLVRALAIFEQQLGTRYPDTASILNNLAELYKSQGKYAEVEALLVRALAIQEQQLGATHPNTAVVLNNLAELYKSQGKYVKAELLYQQALAIREQGLGAQHPDTAISLNNLAAFYYERGKYAEAEPLYQQALTIKDRELDAEHPSMATSLNNLAALYKHQRKYAEAEPLYQRALTIREQRLGATHPDTAISLNNLAELYRDQGKYAEAEPLYQRALAINEQQLGTEHPYTAISLNNLAELYRDQGKYAEAEPLYVRALAIFEQQLGNNHSNMALSLNNLALLYQIQGKYQEAKPLFVRALMINGQQLGITHPTTVQSLDNLAAFYVNQGKYAEAKPLLERVLAIWKQTLGETHPNTLLAKMNYGFLLQAMGQEIKGIAVPQSSHQRESMRKKAKNKRAKQSRKSNRNR
jgi:tetratricopeptide (TPR) repeat protein